MKNRKSLPILLAGLLALIAVMSVGGVFAQDDMQAVTIAATEDGLVVPETIEAGWAEITFENTSELPFYSIIARVDEGATMDEVMGSLFGVMSGESNMLPPATFLGSPMALPGESQSAMYNLEAGNYVLLSVAGEMPDMAPFVVEGEMSEMEMDIEADVTVTLADFAFVMPTELEAGEQIWEIENGGDQWHEMVFISVPEGSTMEDAMGMLMPPEEADAEGEAAAEEEGPSMEGVTWLWSPMSSEESRLVNVDLAAGTYLVLCFIPDVNSEEGVSHAEQGMIQIVTVAEAEA